MSTSGNGNEFELVHSPLPKEYVLIDRYWKASNYLAVGQVREVFELKNGFGQNIMERELMLDYFLFQTDLSHG
jgi:hypothetical protein